MTCNDIGEYVEQQKAKEKAHYKQTSTIQYRLGQFYTNIFSARHPKVLSYNELFPEFNDENNTSKEEAIEKRWREFLGVVK